MRRFRLIASHVPTLCSALAAFLLLFSSAIFAQKDALGLDGAPRDPLSSSRGKIVVLIFVRIDCPISNRYAPLVRRLSTQYADKTSFWLIYPDKSTSAEAIRKHEHDFGYTLPALRDPLHVLVKQSQVQVTPEVAVFDANRRLVYHGRIDNLFQDFGHARREATTHELDEAIRAALAGTPAPEPAPGVGCYISDLK